MDLESVGSFQASLRSLAPGCTGLVVCTQKLVEFDSGGWLVVDKHNSGGDVVRLNFQFIERKGNRLHYNIGCNAPKAYQGAKLGVSTNGFLGLYQLASVTDFWKIEVLGEGANGPLIYLRDHLGSRVGYKDRRENVSNTSMKLVERSFLSVNGSVVQFCLEDIVAL
ncbi:hypothetical protein [Pseudomonas sp. H9]|uniref:hypothetical protein n=1 Tax=Pseudomonas sp. H9 TaxID=483968 RepID=UPI001057A70F|nr:hypothetical protein [Pseudomonas sp. H9]TDF77429.1 hypothetical protein E1573_25065 [Pseudomonas sp. H9]